MAFVGVFVGFLLLSVVQSVLWQSPRAGVDLVRYDIEGCMNINTTAVAECMKLNPDIWAAPMDMPCFINVTFVDYHPATEEQRREKDSFTVNPCLACLRFIRKNDMIVTKSLAARMKSQLKKESRIPTFTDHFNFTLHKLEVLEKYFPESFGDFVRKALGVEWDIEKKPFRKCAAVGNSENLLQYSMGPLIDSHDIVMRFNRGPTQGFEKYVGSKTTIRILNPGRGRSYWHEYDDEVLLLRYADENDFPKLPKLKNQIYFVYDLHPIYPLASGLGLLGLSLLDHLCDEVHAFGYGAEPFITYGHYYPGTIGTLGNVKRTREVLVMADCTDLFRIHP